MPMKPDTRKKWRDANREKLRSQSRDWKRRNPDKVKEQNRRRRLKYKDEIAAKKLAWAKANPDKVAAARKRYLTSNRIKHAARMCLRNAIICGAVVRPKKCERCNKRKKVQGHHHDYSKPLDVEWLCSPCHTDSHFEEYK